MVVSLIPIKNNQPCIESLLTYGLLVLLVLCGVYIRVSGLSEWYWNADDVFHLMLSEETTVSSVINNVMLYDTHPPLSYLILHFMLKLSRNVIFLRCISLVPSIILIPVYYAIGKQAFGRIAGLFMAYAVTFGTGIIILSETIRSYDLYLVLLAGGIWCLANYNKNPKRQYLYLYTALMCASIFTLYISVLFIAAAGIIWFWRIYRKHGYHELRLWVLLNCIIITAFGICYYYCIYPHWLMTHQGHVASATWFSLGYPDAKSRILWVANFLGIFFYLSNTNIISVLFFLTFWIGCYLCITEKKSEYTFLFFLILCINILLSIIGYYPFMPDRHSVCLFTIITLITGLPVQKISESIPQNVTKNRITLLLFLFVFCALIICSTLYIKSNNFYRTKADSFSLFELEIRKKSYEYGLQSLLNIDATPDDIIIIDYDTAVFLLYEIGFENVQKMGELYKIPYKGKVFYSFLNMDTEERTHIAPEYFYRDIIEKLPDILALKNNHHIWIASNSWCSFYNIALPILIPPPNKKTEPLRSSVKQNRYYNLAWKLYLSKAVSNVTIRACNGSEQASGTVIFRLDLSRADKKWFQ